MIVKITILLGKVLLPLSPEKRKLMKTINLLQMVILRTKVKISQENFQVHRRHQNLKTDLGRTSALPSSAATTRGIHSIIRMCPIHLSKGMDNKGRILIFATLTTTRCMTMQDTERTPYQMIPGITKFRSR